MEPNNQSHVPNDSTHQNFDSVPLTKQTQISSRTAVGKAFSGQRLMKSSASIADLWADVMEHYDSERRHQEFILACYRAGCLYYASQKYARILNSSSTESIALKMQNQIEVLANKDRYAKPVETGKLRPSRISGLIAVIGILIALFGFISPSFRNLVGVGISIFVMSIGLRYFSIR